MIEALIVLAVAGAALMLIFSVGLRSTDIAFRLGRRALDVADRQLSTDALRVVIRGLTLPPAQTDQPNQDQDQDQDFIGAPRQFSGPAVLAAATPCADSGPAGRVTVSLAGDARGDVVICRVDGGAVVELVDLRPRRARFSYSDDGLSWSDHWRVASGPTTAASPPRARAVLVRLATDDGRVEVLERATSGRPDLTPSRTPAPVSGTPAL